MTIYKTKNISLKNATKLLSYLGAKKIRTSGGHYIWSHKNLNRSIPIQSHIDPVPEFIIKEILEHFSLTPEEMWNIIKPTKGTQERKTKVAKKGKRAKKGNK